MKIKLNIRKTLDNNLIIYDHPKLLIFVSPQSNKILTTPKTEKIDEEIFLASKKMFDFLVEKGLVDPASVRGGAVYKSTEATYADSKELKALNVVLKTLYEFLVVEKEYYNRAMQGKEEFEDELTDPSDENSTELGEIPQKSEDGTMPKYSTYSDTFYGYNL